MKLAKPTLLAITLSLQACGGGGGSDNNGGNTNNGTDAYAAAGYYAPNYSDARSDTRYETDLSSVTSRVINYQSVGQDLISKITVSDSMIQLFADYKVKLTQASKNSCPSGVQGCDTTDSNALGVGHRALIAKLDYLKNSVKDQSERGTCVAFATNAASELLLARQNSSTTLSEQNTYFQGKRLTNSWDSAGLDPYTTIGDFIDQKTRFVPSTSWPYNGDDKSCTRYNSKYPNATCSATEAQGGGSDSKQQDPAAQSASGYSLTTAHKLYASVGRVKQALYRGYPVVMSVNANFDFQVATYKGGVVSWTIKADNCGTSLCGHEILAVGYQDDDKVAGGGYVIVKNSWSSTWGDGGLAYVTYEWLQHSLLDAQAVVKLDSVQ